MGIFLSCLVLEVSRSRGPASVRVVSDGIIRRDKIRARDSLQFGLGLRFCKVIKDR